MIVGYYFRIIFCIICLVHHILPFSKHNSMHNWSQENCQGWGIPLLLLFGRLGGTTIMHCVGGPDAFIPCDLHSHQTKAAGCTWQADAPVAIAADAFDKVNAYKQLSAQVPSSGGGGTDQDIGNNQTCAQASPHVSVCELNFVQGSPTVPLCVCMRVCVYVSCVVFFGTCRIAHPCRTKTTSRGSWRACSKMSRS